MGSGTLHRKLRWCVRQDIGLDSKSERQECSGWDSKVCAAGVLVLDSTVLANELMLIVGVISLSVIS